MYQKKAKSLLEEFRAFALKGNVVDLAVAVIIGAAFGKIVSSLVNDIIMPVVGVLVGGVNLTDLSGSVGEVQITYGVFLQSVIDFIIVAVVIFAAIKLMSVLQRREEEKPEENKVVEPDEEIKLLREIRDSLNK